MDNTAQQLPPNQNINQPQAYSQPRSGPSKTIIATVLLVILVMLGGIVGYFLATGKNKTVITISHRFSTVRNANKIFVIDKGKVIESGSHQTLLAKKGTYAKLFNIQAERYK